MNKSKNIKLIIGSLVFLIFSATIIVLIIFVFTKNNNEFTNIFNNNIALKGNKDTSSTQYKFWDGQKDDNQSDGKLTFNQLDHPCFKCNIIREMVMVKLVQSNNI